MKFAVRQRKPRVEMTPLMDIIFLLLVFFVYAMLIMTVHRGMPMTLPTSSETVPETEVRLSVSIMTDGTLYIDKAKVTPEELKAVLISHREQSPDNVPVVQLFGEDSLEYRQLYKVLDMLKSAGITKISLQAVRE